VTVGAPPLLGPLHRALVPVDSEAAEQVSAPNYDEYLDDLEVFREIRRTWRSSGRSVEGPPASSR